MPLNEYESAMRDRSSTDPTVRLWQSVHYGDYDAFIKLKPTIQNINEYKYGITLLHALVYNDRSIHFGDNQEDFKTIIANKAKIAQLLLELGADLNSPALNNAPWGIYIGQTPWQMAVKFDNLPFYHRYSAGMRASLVYTGEHVLPVFKRHLGIEDAPSMLTSFYDVCSKNALPLAAIVTIASAVAVAKYTKSPRL